MLRICWLKLPSPYPPRCDIQNVSSSFLCLSAHLIVAWNEGMYLQHVQKCRLSGVVESQKQEFGMLVGESEACEDVPNCTTPPKRAHQPSVCFTYFRLAA